MSLFPFDNSYARLPDRFYARQDAAPVAAPRLLRLNHALAAELGLDADALSSEDGVAALAGNATPEGAAPLAQAYAGHQFGGWSPQLGDGRALLLGEVVDRSGRRRDIQLKGSGRTPFSRGGDGRAPLGPVIREYIVSEAMARMGVPTTRALAAVATGEPVYREAALPGGVLTRVAASHIRVGTFQYFAAREDAEALDLLTRHALERHDPDGLAAPVPALALLTGVIDRQARLVAKWMSLGFIHGVMNTDNMTISGETIDYGPCAFIDGFQPDKVFSSIDQYGRYAYDRQPQIAHWNLAQLAMALMPLLAESDGAVDAAKAALEAFPKLFDGALRDAFAVKFGIDDPTEADDAIIGGFLQLMAAERSDFTLSFRRLADAATGDDGPLGALIADEGLSDWLAKWRERTNAAPERLNAANPILIPRNHQVEAAIAAAYADDMTPFAALDDALAAPFTETEATAAYAIPPKPEEEVTRTFCGT